jgi:hypothetical protein
MIRRRSNVITRSLVRFYSMIYQRECARFRSDANAILERLWAGNLSVRRADWLAAAEISRARGG